MAEAALLNNNINIYFVNATMSKPYHVVNWLNTKHILNSEELSLNQGDIFLGLDFSLDTIPKYWKQLSSFKNSGAQIWFVLYDLLPLSNPFWFSAKLAFKFKKWFSYILFLADGFFCISKETEKNLKHYLPNKIKNISTCVIPMGWELKKSIIRKEVTSNVNSIKDILTEKFILMVGTLEPRKGHQDIVDAFELLWERNISYKLVIIGKPGWKTQKLQYKLKNHPLKASKIFWFSNLDDDLLVDFYSKCQGVIVASYDEGFGLPLLEALGYKKPVLARDIPVFQHTKNNIGVTYFPQKKSIYELSESIYSWLENIDTFDRTLICLDPTSNWHYSFSVILQALSNNISRDILEESYGNSNTKK